MADANINLAGYKQTFEFLKTTTCRSIAEIGVSQEGASLEFARFLKGKGELHLYDYYERVTRVQNYLHGAGYRNVIGFGTSPPPNDSYCWSLGRVIQQNSHLIGRLYTHGQIAVPQPIYDYIVIDCAHSQACDAPTAILADRLLKVGGYLDFVDNNTTFAQSLALTPIANAFVSHDLCYREVVPNRIFQKVGALSRQNAHALKMPTGPEPVVSCLTVTRGRVWSLRRAVACFQAQTVSAAELIILYENDDTATAEYVKSLQDPAVRCISVEAGLKLGALRNLAVASAQAPFIAQWDDDDWYAPERLETQLAAISKSGKACCLLSRWTVYHAHSGKAYISSVRPWEGSLVVRRESQIPYNGDLARGEDMQPVQSLLDRDQLVLLDRPELYVYVYHGGNTWEEKHFAAICAAGRELPETQAKLITEKLDYPVPNAK